MIEPLDNLYRPIGRPTYESRKGEIPKRPPQPRHGQDDVGPYWETCNGAVNVVCGMGHRIILVNTSLVSADGRLAPSMEFVTRDGAHHQGSLRCPRKGCPFYPQEILLEDWK